MDNGAVSIGDSSVFKGTIVANNGAIDLLKGSSLDSRALTFETSNLPSGIYFYKVTGNGKVIQSGKLISQQ